MTTRKLLSVMKSSIDSMPFTDESRKDVKISFKRLKEDIKLINHYKRENKNLIKEIEDLENTYKDERIILNIFKNYFSICDDKTSFDSFLTSNYAYKYVQLIKNFLGNGPEKVSCNFELVIPNDKFNDELLSKIKSFKNYAYILHDKDLNIKPHYHIYIGGFSSYSKSGISNFLNLDPGYITLLYRPIRFYLNYLTHDYLFDKAKYDKSEIVKNF